MTPLIWWPFFIWLCKRFFTVMFESNLISDRSSHFMVPSFLIMHYVPFRSKLLLEQRFRSEKGRTSQFSLRISSLLPRGILIQFEKLHHVWVGASRCALREEAFPSCISGPACIHLFLLLLQLQLSQLIHACEFTSLFHSHNNLDAFLSCFLFFSFCFLTICARFWLVRFHCADDSGRVRSCTHRNTERGTRLQTAYLLRR